ncbi:MAG TPA: ABC transporter permease subunit [Marinobacter sp.]|nr:ABC transporter permease subunit [Marinobacter sp.]
MTTLTARFGQSMAGRTRSLLASLAPSQLASTLKQALLPLIGILLFLGLWQLSAPQVQTSLGAFPGPAQVWEQAGQLWQDHFSQRERASQFIAMQEQRNERLLAANPDADVRIRSYPGAPTFPDQIVTSLVTVLAGFTLATLVAVPMGIVVGLNRHFQAAVNPDLLNVSRVLKLSFWTHVRKVVLPSSVPMIFTGLRVSLGIAWMVLIAAEMLAQSPGLGKFVWDEFQNGSSQSLSRIMVAVLAIGFIGFLLDRCMLLIQKKVAWNE